MQQGGNFVDSDSVEDRMPEEEMESGEEEEEVAILSIV